MLALLLAACTQKRPFLLPAQAPITQHLAGDAAYSTGFLCERAEVVLVVVAQDNLDLSLRVTSQLESRNIEVDSPSLRFGQEVALVNCFDNEQLTLHLKSRDPKVPGGEFRLTVSRFSKDTPARVIEAYQRTSEAGQVHAAGGSGAWMRSADLLKSAASTWRSHGLHELEALNEYQLASLYYLKLLDWEQAVKHARRAYDLYETLDHAEGLASAGTLLGAALEELAFASTSDSARSDVEALFTEAEQTLTTARSRQLQLGRSFDAAMSLDYLAICRYYRGRYADAIEEFTAAEREFLALGERTARIMVLQNLATILAEFGRYGTAITAFERLTSLIDENEDTLTHAAVAGNYVNALRGAGDLERALEVALQALELNRRRDDAGGEARVLYKIADLYQRIGDSDRALQFYTQALPKAVSANQRRFVFRTLAALGDVHRDRGDLASATRLHMEALQYAREGLDQAQLQLAIGLDLSAAGRHATALERFSASARALPPQQNPYLAVALTEQGRTHGILGQRALAFEVLNQALTLTTANDRPIELSNTLRELALVEFAGGKRPKALERMDEAIKLLESIHGRTLSPLLRANFRQSRRATYTAQVRFLMADAKPCAAASGCFEGDAALKALQAVEGGRARWSADVRMLDSVDTQLESLWDELRERRTALDELESAAAAADKRAALASEIALLRTRVELKERALNAGSSRSSGSGAFDAHRLAELQHRLGKNGAAIEFLLATPRSWAWVITADDVFAIELPSSNDIESAATKFSTAVRAPGNMETAVAAAHALHEMLRPAFARLRATELRIVPDGILHSIPLHTAMRLANPRQTQPALTLAPSLVALATRSADDFDARAQQRLVFIAGAYSDAARLPFAEKEGAQVASFFAPERRLVLAAGNATREAITGIAFETQDVLHIAAHSESDIVDPAMSRIVLDSGKNAASALLFTDIVRLRAPVELIVLSGCETAVGRRFPGDGMASLSTAFLDAGARRVVASLWKVPDEATTAWMSAFYAALIERRQTPSRALLAAEDAVSSNPKWRHPYYWSAFTLTGVN